MNGTTTEDGEVEQMVEQIRQFAEEMEDAENWMIIVPIEPFDAVKERLDVDESGLGTDYKGAAFCYNQDFKEVRVKYSTPLSEYLNHS